MRARLTSDNQIVLPDSVASSFKGIEHFEIAIEDGRLVLTPVGPTRADSVRSKLADLGLSESDVTEAVAWARRC